MLWLAIRFPELPLEAAIEQNLLDAHRQEHNAERDGLSDGLTRNGALPELVVSDHHQVFQASTLALQRGIKPGIKISSARALCDNLHVLDRNQAAEQETLKRLAQRLLFISPTVCLSPPHALLVEVAGCLKLFNGLDNLFTALRQSLNRTPHQWFYGLGHTPLCANLLATHSPDSDYHYNLNIDRSRFLQELKRIPIESLPLENTVKSALQAPGFRLLEEILALPKSALGKRQGRDFLDWLQRLLGEKADIREAIKVPLRFYAEVEFSDPVSQIDGLIFPAQRLLNELHYFLRQHQKSTRAIRWHFTDSKKNVTRIIIRRSSSNADLSLWQDLTRRHLDQLTLSSETLKLALDCAGIQHNTQHSAEMFEDPSQRPDKKILIDKLAALTQLKLSVIETVDSHLPDDSQLESHPLAKRARHNTGSLSAPPDRALPEHSDSLFYQAPLWLLDKPRPLKQKNNSLYFRGEALEVLPGEQVINDGWWQQEQTRHYRLARHTNGMACWIYFSPQTQQWYLHGFF